MKVLFNRFKELEKLVLVCDWDMRDNYLSMTIEEDEKFDVYQWIESLKACDKNRQKSPFADTETWEIALQNTNIRFEFKNLGLLYHKAEVPMDNAIDPTLGLGPFRMKFRHKIHVSYGSCDFSQISLENNS
jgi:hypothetical protein